MHSTFQITEELYKVLPAPQWTEHSQITQLQGFITAIAINPTPIAVDQWQKFILPSLNKTREQPVKVLKADLIHESNLTQLKLIKKLSQQLCLQIGQDLRQENTFIPLCYDGKQLVTYQQASWELLAQWCQSYLAGIQLDSQWSQDDFALSQLMPLSILAGDFNLAGQWDNQEQRIEDDAPFKEKSRDILPQILSKLYSYWKINQFYHP